MRYWLSILLVAVFASSAGCHREAAVTADGRTPVRAYLMLLNTKQVEYFSWAEATFEAQHPDIDIIIEQFPGSSLKDYEIKIRLRYASKQSPDIWVFRENALSEFVNLGLLAPAPPYIERIVQENSLNELIRQAPYFDGTCYGIVQLAAWQALYYNKEMFREAGLDPEQPPETWEEMMDYADKLTIRRPDGTIERAGLSLRKTGYKPGISEKWLTFFYSAGGTPFNEDGTESHFNSEAGHEATALYKEAMDRNIDAVEVEGDQQGFGQERVAMFIRELHVVDWMKVNYPDVEFGVAQIPKEDTTFSSGGAYPMVVSSESEHQEEAWRFLEFLMSDDVYARYAETMHEMPTLKSVAERPQFKNDPYLQVFINQPAYIPPKFPHDKRSLEILGAYLERFAYGHLSIEETLDRATEDINAHLQTNYARYHRNTNTAP
ncbi:MAG TPA: extracellular solute-binding protein [Rhodothermales bacterium]|nr:extracellular solute-binding protein [Rhodothermales bacterium]